jgi:Rieske Fe-S protein
VEPKRDERPEQPRPTVWPVGFAVGVVCLLVGLVVSWAAVAVGGAIALVFGFLWVRDVTSGHRVAAAPAPAPASPSGVGERERFPRNKFLEASTLGLGAVIGGVVTVPPLVLAVLPPFLKQGRKDIDVGPLGDYPENQWVLTTFMLDPEQGEVTRRTAFIRYNGVAQDPATRRQEPSFTIISNRCAHLGCPTQPNGLVQDAKRKTERASGGETIQLTPVVGLSGFGCPCHGGQYDKEGNRIAGPPVRGLDRYSYSIRTVNGSAHLFLGKTYSVSHVDGSGADARIHKYKLANPGDHVDGWEQIFYPFQPPH